MLLLPRGIHMPANFPASLSPHVTGRFRRNWLWPRKRAFIWRGCPVFVDKFVFNQVESRSPGKRGIAWRFCNPEVNVRRVFSASLSRSSVWELLWKWSVHAAKLLIPLSPPPPPPPCICFTSNPEKRKGEDAADRDTSDRERKRINVKSRVRVYLSRFLDRILGLLRHIII